MSDTQQNAAAGGAPAADAGAQQPAVRKFKAVFINRFQMEATLPNSRGDVPATLSWGAYRGNPRITVRSNDPGDQEINYGKIEASMDIGTFEFLAERITFAASQEPGFKEKIINKSTYKGKQRFDQPEVVNATLIGKDADGRVWISVVEDSRPTPRFFFGPSKFHQVIRADGSPLPDNEASCHFARVVMKALTGIMQNLAARAAHGDEEGGDDSKPAGAGGQASQGGQGGGWQRNNNGGGGWKGGQGGGGGGWQNRNGGGGGGGWKGNGGGGGQGGWQRGGGQGGGGGGWQGRQGGQGGGGQGGYQAQKAEAAVASVSNDDITF